MMSKRVQENVASGAFTQLVLNWKMLSMYNSKTFSEVVSLDIADCQTEVWVKLKLSISW